MAFFKLGVLPSTLDYEVKLWSATKVKEKNTMIK